MLLLDDAVQALGLVEVFRAGEYDYEWSEFVAWRAPTGRFYWFADSGCSCTCYGDGFNAIADFSDGDRDALEREYRAWADGSRDAEPKVPEGLEKIRLL